MQRINSILIANRGEIVSRIIRTCRKMGIRSIAVFSDADRQAPFVREADEALHLGGSSPTESYLNQQKVIAAAKQAGADAIHPGYGFLAENASFARACTEAGMIFIGPSAEAIEEMGSKSRAKVLMRQHEVPIIPGYQGEDQSEEKLAQAAREIGFPVLLKAAAGGGGKGMRIVNQADDIASEIAAARREALSAFGNDEFIIEKYFPSSRHIEFQIFGDKHGKALHLLERECSIQRRYQKIIEESPSPAVDAELRAKMGKAAVKAAQALGYDNAGTVEFLLAPNGDFFFLEVNTRLQVEHPVTEAVTGLDLVRMQIEVAEGKALTLKQEDIHHNGYAIECRLYAEDPQNEFRPVTGKVLNWKVPRMNGFRIDAGVETHSDISVYYDPMIAKVICWGKDRSRAQRKMSFALQNLLCQGLTTNQDLLEYLLQNEDFQIGNYDTHFLKHIPFEEDLQSQKEGFFPLASIAACLYGWQQRQNQRSVLKHLPSGWRNSFSLHQNEEYSWKDRNLKIEYRFIKNGFQALVDSKEYKVQIESSLKQGIRLKIEEQGQTARIRQFHISEEGDTVHVQSPGLGNIILNKKPRFPEKEAEAATGSYLSPMPSEVLEVKVAAGQAIKSGESLLVLSSMKMENTIAAWEDGIIDQVFVKAGDHIEAGMEMISMQDKS